MRGCEQLNIIMYLIFIVQMYKSVMAVSLFMFRGELRRIPQFSLGSKQWQLSSELVFLKMEFIVTTFFLC